MLEFYAEDFFEEDGDEDEYVISLAVAGFATCPLHEVFPPA